MYRHYEYTPGALCEAADSKKERGMKLGVSSLIIDVKEFKR